MSNHAATLCIFLGPQQQAYNNKQAYWSISDSGASINTNFSISCTQLPLLLVSLQDFPLTVDDILRMTSIIEIKLGVTKIQKCIYTGKQTRIEFELFIFDPRPSCF